MYIPTRPPGVEQRSRIRLAGVKGGGVKLAGVKGGGDLDCGVLGRGVKGGGDGVWRVQARAATVACWASGGGGGEAG